MFRQYSINTIIAHFLDKTLTMTLVIYSPDCNQVNQLTAKKAVTFLE